MNLDDLSHFQHLDPEDMYGNIDRLPEQLEEAWELGMNQPLQPLTGIQHIVVAGMGGSAIGADLLAAYVSNLLPVPLVVLRDYTLPAYARGPETLVIASSHSGNTGETLAAFAQAVKNGCQVLAVTTGGSLAQHAAEANVPVLQFVHAGQPRAAVGFSFSILLAALVKAGLLPDQEGELRAAVSAMRQQQESIRMEVPAVRNPAKRLAGQMVGRWVTVFASDYLTPVARRWKTQINEIAKAWAEFEFLPEADHNTLAGVLNPEELLSHGLSLFLQAPSDHPRNRMRSDLTRQGLMREGINTDTFTAAGDQPLAHIWTTLHFGDYLSYYLAMAYGVDPTPVEALEGLKKAMKR